MTVPPVAGTVVVVVEAVVLCAAVPDPELGGVLVFVPDPVGAFWPPVEPEPEPVVAGAHPLELDEPARAGVVVGGGCVVGIAGRVVVVVGRVGVVVEVGGTNVVVVVDDDGTVLVVVVLVVGGNVGGSVGGAAVVVGNGVLGAVGAVAAVVPGVPPVGEPVPQAPLVELEPLLVGAAL